MAPKGPARRRRTAGERRFGVGRANPSPPPWPLFSATPATPGARMPRAAPAGGLERAIRLRTGRRAFPARTPLPGRPGGEGPAGRRLRPAQGGIAPRLERGERLDQGLAVAPLVLGA